MQEKSFEQLWQEVSAEFSDYTVTMGICKYEHTPKPIWWIEILSKKDPVKTCSCCDQPITKVTKFSTYSNETFETALNDIRIKEANHVKSN